jgi:very-short-patch-repair endonuclease
MSSRTARFAKFLRAAVDVKIKKVTEIGKYPFVQWYSELPVNCKEVLSPVTSEDWDPEDHRWLVVPRASEPDLPPLPRGCQPWVEGVNVRDPEKVPELLPSRTRLDESGSETVIQPDDDVRQQWRKYLEEKWVPWAERIRIARQVRPIYQRLFSMHQEMQGREDAYELLVGVGLYHDRTDPGQILRRHLLGFPAELQFDARTGTLTVLPSGDFTNARIEEDFLPPTHRARMQPHAADSVRKLQEMGPTFSDRSRVSEVVSTLVHALGPQTAYVDDVRPNDAPASSALASFAPALILRPRGARSLDELLKKIEEKGEQGPLESMFPPWRRLLEDERVWATEGPGGADGHTGATPTRIYFPLPTNEEQLKIVRHSNGGAGVVVQGPPGTGKSHTIANLISHYLATGQRVLVTAQTAQALNVLKSKLPGDLQALCVNLLGAGRESDRDLERSVRGILRRQMETANLEARRLDADRLEGSLAHSERELQRLERILHDARMAETTVVTAGSYRDTRAGIARRLQGESATLGWIDDEVPHETACPTYSGGWAELATYHASLDEKLREELGKTWFALPFTADFAGNILRRLDELRGSPVPDVNGPTLPSSIQNLELKALLEWLETVRDCELTTSNGDLEWVSELRTAVFGGDTSKWRVVAEEAAELMSALTPQVIGAILPVSVSGRSEGKALQDLQRLNEHYGKGGRRRVLGFMKPAAIKATEWLEISVELDGAPIRTAADVEKALRALAGARMLRDAHAVWQRWPVDASGSPRQQAAALTERLLRVSGFLAPAEKRERLPADCKGWLQEAARNSCSTEILRAVVQRRLYEIEVGDLRRSRDELVEQLRSKTRGLDVTPSFAAIETALRTENAESFAAAVAEHVGEGKRRARHSDYVTFIAAVRRWAPKTAAAIVAVEGTRSWAQRFEAFAQAWDHRRASVWLSLILSDERLEATERAANSERVRSQELTADLTAAWAWFYGLKRIDEGRRQNLVGWSQAVARIPRTGPSVFRRRAVARDFLSRCLDAIPAWVVSLGRLYDTVDPTPGLFDVAIIDEASQCWLDSLVLFYLAKRVIVVGDDKQISPTIVGVQDGQIEQLANTYLPDLQHRGLFTLESSLFDHARRYLPASIPLREHFRCVPEIIRFSNEQFYPDHPLIPLRQCGKHRLEPLKAVYVSDGLRHGDINEAEAQAIVDAVVACHTDERYDDCHFGVVCLQGDDQAKHVEKLLLDKLGPAVFAERRLRCGDAYAFQGDERDVMFLSMVAGPNTNNGVLVGSRHEQRVNVALSRACDQAWLFHSVREQDVSPQCLRRKVLTFFYQPTDQSIRGVPLDIPALRLRAQRADRTVERAPVPFDSWFEVDVALALVARGYELSAQVQVASKRIDLVVEGEGVRLAVECDGDEWHGPEQYEADMMRQRQLERAGWRFARVRESMFRSYQERAIREVLDACEELGIQPGGTRPESAPEPAGTHAQTAFTPDVLDGDEPAIVAEEQDVLNEPSSMAGAAPLSVTPGDRVVRSADHVPELFTDGREGPYTGYEGKGYPDPRAASAPDIRTAVLNIVETDGPLPKGSIYLLYRDGCPHVERAGKSLKQAVNGAVAALRRSGKLLAVDEGGANDPTEIVIRAPEQLPVVVRQRGARPIEGIPLSELAYVYRELSGGMRPQSYGEASELQRRVLERFELRNLTERARGRLAHAERLAFDDGLWQRLGGESATLF